MKLDIMILNSKKIFLFLNNISNALLSETRSYKIFTAFSARQNFNELSRADESNPSLRILYGVRTICILCIIMDHRFGTFLSSSLFNFDYIEMVSINIKMFTS